MPARKSSQSEKTNQSENIKKQLEVLSGQKININADRLINTLGGPIGVFDKTDGFVAWRWIFYDNKVCADDKLLDASGISSTGDAGTQTFLLSDFVCLPDNWTLVPPVNVLATALSATPLFVTTTYDLVKNGTNVQITVFSWDATGAAAPYVQFDWRCRVAYIENME